MKRKVAVIGYGKTGTKTMGQCLSLLGYRRMGGPLDLLEDWQAGRMDRIFATFRAHDAVDDFPWPMVYREIDAEFPGTRFILTERRDSAIWYDSLKRHYDRSGPTTTKLIAYGHYSPYEAPEAHVARYEAHGQAVRDYFAGRPDDLLVMRFDAGDGWPELCRFLGKAEPGVPMPHANADERGPLARQATHLVAHGHIAEAWDLILKAPAEEAVEIGHASLPRAIRNAPGWRFETPRAGRTPGPVLAAIDRACWEGRPEEAIAIALANHYEDEQALGQFRGSIRRGIARAVGTASLGDRVMAPLHRLKLHYSGARPRVAPGQASGKPSRS